MPAQVDRFELEVPATADPQSQAAWGSLRRALDAVGERTAAIGEGPYTPATAADWASPAPTTIADALDRLAAQVAVLGAAPVP